MPVEPGWEVSKDRMREYNFIRAKLMNVFEQIILTTKMKRGRQFIRTEPREGLVVLSDRGFYFVKKVSVLESVASDYSDAITIIPFAFIVKFEYEGNGKYAIYRQKLDWHGKPKMDKYGNYKTVKEVFEVISNKNEEPFKCVERKEQFGYFLRKVIDDFNKKWLREGIK